MPVMTIETISETRCFGGKMGFYRHHSQVNDCDMQFAVFVPPQAADGKLPVLTFLSGLTCTEENFMVKSGAQRLAAELGIMLVSPDTSPRGEGVPDGLTGHSMGGHGALTIGLRNPQMFRSLSAFAPICTTLHSPWGQKALTHYLGADSSAWINHDAAEVARNVGDPSHYDKILVDQGLDDVWLQEQLKPELLEAACAESGLNLELRRHAGYDHGYYFISTFIADHLQFHAKRLSR